MFLFHVESISFNILANSYLAKKSITKAYKTYNKEYMLETYSNNNLDYYLDNF